MQQALLSSVKKDDLPLPAGALWVGHMLPARRAGSQLDVKRSTYKKLSKFLQVFTLALFCSTLDSFTCLF